MSAANKRYSYLRVAAIRIDVYHVGKNTTNTSQASHAQSAYGPRPYISHVVNTYQPFTKSSTDLYRSTTLEKKGSQHNPQLNDCLIYGSVPSFSPTTTNETVGKRQVSVDNQLLGLPGP
jgi:hypothetical protein